MIVDIVYYLGMCHKSKQANIRQKFKTAPINVVTKRNLVVLLKSMLWENHENGDSMLLFTHTYLQDH